MTNHVALVYLAVTAVVWVAIIIARTFGAEPVHGWEMPAIALAGGWPFIAAIALAALIFAGAMLVVNYETDGEF